MSRDDFLNNVLATPDDYARRLEALLRAFEPSMNSADYPVYTCRECGQAYRGPICGHCGARNYEVGPDLTAWPATSDTDYSG